MIFLDNRLPETRQRFICAHEFGHISLGHVGALALAEDTRRLPKKVKERAAMVFAAELVIPQYAFASLRVESVEQLQKLCGVDYRPAFYSLMEWKRMTKKEIVRSDK